MATTCPTAKEKPRVAKVRGKSNEKDAKTQNSSSERSEEQAEVKEAGGEESMKALLDEASLMLKAMNESEAKEKRQKGEDAEQKILGLQRQLDQLKKASLKPFRISRLCPMVNKGLLDSGATHPLRARRKGERLQHLAEGQGDVSR